MRGNSVRNVAGEYQFPRSRARFLWMAYSIRSNSSSSSLPIQITTLPTQSTEATQYLPMRLLSRPGILDTFCQVLQPPTHGVVHQQQSNDNHRLGQCPDARPEVRELMRFR